jgi:hypothetical protein
MLFDILEDSAYISYKFTYGSIKGERCLVYPDIRDDKQRRLEFSTSTVNILNSLEQMGYRVVTSGSFVASQVSTVLVGLG